MIPCTKTLYSVFNKGTRGDKELSSIIEYAKLRLTKK